MRMYYRNRMFMGVCCISCEVLYLSVSFLAVHRHCQCAAYRHELADC